MVLLLQARLLDVAAACRGREHYPSHSVRRLIESSAAARCVIGLMLITFNPAFRRVLMKPVTLVGLRGMTEVCFVYAIRV